MEEGNLFSSNPLSMRPRHGVGIVAFLCCHLANCNKEIACLGCVTCALLKKNNASDLRLPWLAARQGPSRPRAWPCSRWPPPPPPDAAAATARPPRPELQKSLSRSASPPETNVVGTGPVGSLGPKELKNNLTFWTLTFWEDHLNGLFHPSSKYTLYGRVIVPQLVCLPTCLLQKLSRPYLKIDTLKEPDKKSRFNASMSIEYVRKHVAA